MFKYKLSKDIKKKMDRELRQYWENKKKLKRLELQIIESSNSASDGAFSNTIADTTSQKTLRLLSTRSIIYCEERISYVENVIKKLKPFEKDIFFLIFKEGCDWIYCENIKNINKSTYYNIYNKSIYFLAEEWGEI